MRQELWIDGQCVDLNADTSITLEWVSGLFQDIGSVNLSRSYTIRLPRTARNLRIFDDPGNPSHDSQGARRYLTARYIRNGVDLLGDARAYVSGITPEAIEIGLLWNIASGLLEWRGSGKSLNDIEHLPTLQWVGADNVPDYTNGYFAKYYSGLTASYPTVNAAPHPSVSFWDLFVAIFDEANIPWWGYIDDEANEIDSLYRTKILCDGHRPSLAMEIASGSSAASASAYDGISFDNWTHGWDPIVREYAGYDGFEVGDNASIRIIINFKNCLDGYSIGETPIKVVGVMTDEGIADATTLAEYYFDTDAEGVEHCSVDDVVDFSGFTTFRIDFSGAPASRLLSLPAYDETLPAFSVSHVHESIVISQQNQFPVAENLPDMTQVDFIKGACALLGLASIVTASGRLTFIEYSRLLDTSRATDWTGKVAGDPESITMSAEGFAQRNYIKYTEDVEIRPSSPDAVITVDDETITSSRDMFKLPFAASNGRVAEHYRVTSEFDKETLVTTYEVEDIEIKPRIFVWETDSSGNACLTFPDYLKSDALVAKYYGVFQEIVRKPVVINALIRLHEIDLAQLDLTRPVYLRQYGHYYFIMKIQTSDTDLCKVELLQIPA